MHLRLTALPCKSIQMTHQVLSTPRTKMKYTICITQLSDDPSIDLDSEMQHAVVVLDLNTWAY